MSILRARFSFHKRKVVVLSLLFGLCVAVVVIVITIATFSTFLRTSGFDGERSARDQTYGSAPKEWSEIFDALNTSKFSAYRLRPEKSGLNSFLEAHKNSKKDRFLATSDFDPSPMTVVIRGEREWSPLLAGFQHLLESPVYENLTDTLRRTAAESDRWRHSVDLLVLARFQNDVLLAARSIFALASRPDYPSGFSVPAKKTKVEHLLKLLSDLLESTLMTEEEIARLPETRDLNSLASEYHNWERRYLYWIGQSTEHEDATLSCFHNEIYVLFPRVNARLFDKDHVDQYIRDGAWPKTDMCFVLLDRLIVLDESRKLRKTPVTVLVRTSRYYSDRDLRPIASGFGDFEVFYLRRRAVTSNWKAYVESAGAAETGAALINLPNVPGFASPYYEVPLRLSCIQCHRGGPKTPYQTGQDRLIEDPRDFYVGEKPRQGG